MDEDEDIIIEGTSLHCHLQETGFLDFEVMTSQNSSMNFENCLKKIKPENTKNTHRKSAKKFLMNLLGIHKIEEEFIFSIAVILINKKLLEEDDLLLLEKLSPSVELLSLEPDVHLNKDYKNEVREKYFGFCCFNSIAAWCAAILASLTQAFTQQIFSILPCLFVFLFAFGSVVSLKYFLLKKCLLMYEKFETYLLLLEKSNKGTRKALKFLNEMKVIRSGLKQKSASVIMKTPHEDSVSSCLHSLFDSLLLMVHSSHLRLKHHKTSELERFESLLSDRFSLDLIEELSTDIDLIYSNLKHTKNVITLQSSAFLTELLLTMEFSRDAFILSSVLEGCCFMDIEERMHLLTRVLNLSQSIWFEETGTKIATKPSVSLEKVKFNVGGAVDVLSLHSKMVGHLVMVLKESCDDDKVDQCSDVDVHFLEIQKYCEEIKSELTSCVGCLEEVSERVEKLYFKKTKNFPQPMTAVTKKHFDETSSKPCCIKNSIPLYELKEHVIVDEVFEAVVDESSMHVSLKEKSEWLQSRKKEKQMIKREQDRCKRVLKEIQPILQQRREMWKEREEKALQRMNVHCHNEDIESFNNNYNINNSYSEKCQQENNILELSHPENKLLGKSSEGSIVLEKSYCNNSFCIEGSIENSADINGKFLLESESISANFESALANAGLDNEYDSEEESLLLYRKVKAELDKDEARRKEEDEDDQYDDNFSELKDIVFNNNEILRLPTFMAYNDEVENSCNSFFANDVGNTIQSDTNNDLKCSEDKQLDYNSSSLPTRLLSTRDSYAEEEPVLSYSLSDTNFVDHTSETFFCGSNSSDEETKPAIDWSSCGFPKKRFASDINETLFNGPTIPLAAEVLSKRSKFTLMKGEEVFGGVGEGEESEEDSISEEGEPES